MLTRTFKCKMGDTPNYLLPDDLVANNQYELFLWTVLLRIFKSMEKL